MPDAAMLRWYRCRYRELGLVELENQSFTAAADDGSPAALNEIEDGLSQVSGSLIVDGVAGAQQEQRGARGIHHKTGQRARVREDLHENIVVFGSRGQERRDRHGQVTGAGLPGVRIEKTEKRALQPHAPMPLAERGTIDFTSLQTRSRNIKLFAGLPIFAV